MCWLDGTRMRCFPDFSAWQEIDSHIGVFLSSPDDYVNSVGDIKLSFIQNRFMMLDYMTCFAISRNAETWSTFYFPFQLSPPQGFIEICMDSILMWPTAAHRKSPSSSQPHKFQECGPDLSWSSHLHSSLESGLWSFLLSFFSGERHSWVATSAHYRRFMVNFSSHPIEILYSWPYRSIQPFFYAW